MKLTTLESRLSTVGSRLSALPVALMRQLEQERRLT